MITTVFEMPGATAQQYDDTCRLVGVSPTNVPDGLIFHSASPTENGWLVVDVWENEEKFRAFGERLLPAIQQSGLAGSHFQPRILRTHAVMGTGKVPAGV